MCFFYNFQKVFTLFNMKHLQENLKKLKLLSNCTNKNRKICINKGNNSLIKTLNECVINTLNGKIKLTDKQYRKLDNYKYHLRNLLRNKKYLDKKKLIIQKGGFLQYILPGAITLITTLLEKYLKR